MGGRPKTSPPHRRQDISTTKRNNRSAKNHSDYSCRGVDVRLNKLAFLLHCAGCCGHDWTRAALLLHIPKRPVQRLYHKFGTSPGHAPPGPSNSINRHAPLTPPHPQSACLDTTLQKRGPSKGFAFRRFSYFSKFSRCARTKWRPISCTSKMAHPKHLVG